MSHLVFEKHFTGERAMKAIASIFVFGKCFSGRSDAFAAGV